MSLAEALKTALLVASVYSWVTLLLAAVPTLFITFVFITGRRWEHAIAGLLGGVGGGFCGAAALFLSLWLSCRDVPTGCNTAQGDMGLLVTFPVGSIAGCLIALLCMNRISSSSRFKNWVYWIGSQIAIWATTTILFAQLMA
jgi:hypothetical protein